MPRLHFLIRFFTFVSDNIRYWTMKKTVLAIFAAFLVCVAGSVRADNIASSQTGNGSPDAPIARVVSANTIEIDADALPSGESRVQVIAITGTVMCDMVVNTDNPSGNPQVENLPKGYYLVRALPSGGRSGEKVKSQKIVVK